MYPNTNDSFADGAAFLLIGFGVAGFVLAFVLRKLGFLASDDSQSRFSMVLSACIAGGAALLADTPASNHWAVELMGRGAIFLIVFFAVGALLSVGIAMAVEKTNKQ